MKSYTVYIEQPLCAGFPVEAESIDDALEIARFKHMSGEFILKADDVSTDAQIMASDDDGSEYTEWDDL